MLIFQWLDGWEDNYKDYINARRAKSDPNFKQHWFPFDPDNEDGMKLYKENWTYGQRWFVESGGTPLFIII